LVIDGSVTPIDDVPFPDGSTRDPSEKEEHHQTECAGKNDCRDELRAPQAISVHVNLCTNTDDAALAEIEVANNRANYCESG
jgi:hypothetical protein